MRWQAPRFRLSVLMGLTALLCATLAVMIRQAKREDLAADALRAGGFDVVTRPAAPWKRIATWSDATTPISLSVKTTAIGSNIPELNIFMNPSTIVLPVDVELLANIGAMPRLESVNLRCVACGDKELAMVGNLSRLEYLNLECSRVTDTGLAHLQELSKLETLVLKGCKISGRTRGRRHPLRHLSLKSLNVAGTEIEDVDVLPLSPRLTSLDLGGLLIDDGDIALIAKRCTQLCDLDLSGTRVTDASINRLASMRTLKQLRLKMCLISTAGLRRLIRQRADITTDGLRWATQRDQILDALNSSSREPVQRDE